MTVLLGDSFTFPNPDASDPRGLVAVGGDLHPDRILSAYRRGIYPWSIDPITWWSPDPRAIVEFQEFHVSRSLRRRIRQSHYRVTFDQAFHDVIQACADRKEDSTWISPPFIDAYLELYRLGVAHSVEAWLGSDLVGGVYGIAIGGLFAGESMFHRKSDASKVALHSLTRALEGAGFQLFDIQMITPITLQLGAREIPRREYLDRLTRVLNLPCQFPSSAAC